MRGSMQAATALGVGYLLGRRRKLRMAMFMAAATAVGRTDIGSAVLKRGVKMLGSTEALGKIAPQLTEIADTVRGDLLTAGKAAATAAVSNQVDSLTDSIHARAERLRNPADTVEDVGEAAGAAGRRGRRAAADATAAARRATGRGRRSEPEDDYEADDADFEQDDYENGDRDDYGNGEPDDYEDDAREPDDDQTDEPAPRRGTSRRRSPVTRAGR